MKAVVAFACGAVFALGLGISGMLQPAKVIGFLDVGGDWDPSLAFVMGPAVGIVLAAWTWRRGRPTPWGPPVPERAVHVLDGRLFAGAALFGIGWGACGVCPGPALTAVWAPGLWMPAVLGALAVGVALGAAVPRKR